MPASPSIQQIPEVAATTPSRPFVGAVVVDMSFLVCSRWGQPLAPAKAQHSLHQHTRRNSLLYRILECDSNPNVHGDARIACHFLTSRVRRAAPTREPYCKDIIWWRSL